MERYVVVEHHALYTSTHDTNFVSVNLISLLLTLFQLKKGRLWRIGTC